MPSVFLSHTSIDKPFVEKLAHDLKRVGVDVWFDKWEIKVGESLTWGIEQGIRENEHLAIVLSPEAISSEWVRSELGAAWAKQMQQKKVVVLPLLYRDCNIPLFLLDRKYADFRSDYQHGFRELAGVLGVCATETISVDNWRIFAKARSGGWQPYRKLEFEQLVTLLVDRAVEYNWSTWVGAASNPFSIKLSAFVNREAQATLSLKLNGRTYAYMASQKWVTSPKHLKAADFNIYVGNSINECEEFVWRRMDDFKRTYGNPATKADHLVSRILPAREQDALIKRITSELSWYKGKAQV